MTPIHVNMDIALQPGYSAYEIDSERDLQITFRGSEQSDVFVSVKKCGALRIRTYAAAGAKISYLFWNNTDQKLSVDESHEVMGNGDLTVAYGECNQAETDRNVYVALRQNHARALLSSATLVNCRKNYNMQVVNYAPDTYGDIKNYAVVLEKGNLMIDAIGKIVKGAHGAQSHQTSRALAFAQGQRAEILPELLIDEDDVQASHALSMGTVDEDQMYYMMSRGLSRSQCTSLISYGYLMPIARTLDNPQLQEMLAKEMERKMNALCSM